MSRESFGAQVGASRRQGGASRRSMVLLAIATGLTLLHHIDHVLRADHSGWPFQEAVTPFTFSLLVYPFLIAAFLLRARPLLSAGAAALVLLFAQFSHTFLETPDDQYGTWASNASTEPYALGQPNLLNVESSVLGVVAVNESVLLSISLLAAVVSFVLDTRRARKT